MTSSASCLVEGNEIGTNASGTAVPNYNGIDVGVSGGTIGGTTTGDANVIAGNSNYGVNIGTSCLVVGNEIGTNAAGTAVPNKIGIYVGGSGVTIGGTTAAAANVIAGNSEYGVYIDAPCLVEGNEIGTNASGTAVPNIDGIYCCRLGRDDRRDDGRRRQCHRRERGQRLLTSTRPAWWRGTRSGRMRPAFAVPNGEGIVVEGSGGTIGGTTTGDANVIAGNTGYGVAHLRALPGRG